MRYGVVGAKTLTPKDLRARFYIPSPDRTAEDCLRQWNKRHGFVLNARSKAYKDLTRMISSALKQQLSKINGLNVMKGVGKNEP